MNAFQVLVGPCSICSKPASFEIGSMACESCGNVFNKICKRCTTGPCPQCKGPLEATKRVFPHSLFQAISKGDEREVGRLLRGRPEPLSDLKDRNGETALALAARFKTAGVAKSMCEALLQAGMSTSAKSDKTERSALITMVEHRRFHRDVAELLKSTINDQDISGKTALMFAAEGAGLFGSPRGNAGLARILITEFGADPAICDKRGVTALGHAIASNKTGKNEVMVDILKEAMLTQAAQREFDAHYSYEFDKFGKLQAVFKKGERSGPR